VFSWEGGGRLKLTTRHHLVLRSRNSGAVPPPPRTCSWCTRDFTFSVDVFCFVDSSLEVCKFCVLGIICVDADESRISRLWPTAVETSVVLMGVTGVSEGL
jgi:hypothetical protein